MRVDIAEFRSKITLVASQLKVYKNSQNWVENGPLRRPAARHICILTSALLPEYVHVLFGPLHRVLLRTYV